MAGGLISFGLGSPAGVSPWLLFGLTPGAAASIIDAWPTIVAVAAEDRALLVAAEDRALVVLSEDRTMLVASAVTL
jgi:hypothetical protein